MEYHRLYDKENSVRLLHSPQLMLIWTWFLRDRCVMSFIRPFCGWFVGCSLSSVCTCISVRMHFTSLTLIQDTDKFLICIISLKFFFLKVNQIFLFFFFSATSCAINVDWSQLMHKTENTPWPPDGSGHGLAELRSPVWTGCHSLTPCSTSQWQQAEHNIWKPQPPRWTLVGACDATVPPPLLHCSDLGEEN